MRRYFIEVNEYKYYNDGRPYTAKKLIFVDCITAITEIKYSKESHDIRAMTKIEHKDLGSIYVTESYDELVKLIRDKM